MSQSSDPRRLTGGARFTPGGPEAGPQSAKAHELVAMAHALCDEGRAREAEDMARWALSQAPQLAAGHTVLARARFEQGHLREALSLLDVVVQRNPGFFIAHRWLAEVLIRLGDWPRASEILVRAEALSPRDPRIGQLVQQVMGASPGQTGPLAARGAGRGSAAAGVSQVLARRGRAGAPTKIVPRSPRTRPGRWSGPRHSPPPRWSIWPRPWRARPRAGNGRVGEQFRARALQHAARADRRRTFFRTWPPIRLLRWLHLYRRFVLLAVIGVGLFALTVKGVSWMLRPSGPQQAQQALDKHPTALAPVLAGSFMELANIRAKDRRRQVRFESEPTGRALLAEALLASEYGRPLDPDSEIWADELAEKEGGLGGPEELLAARVLDRLVRGDRGRRRRAGAHARALTSSDSDLLRFVDGRRLEREGNLAGALARVGSDAERSAFLAACACCAPNCCWTRAMPPVRWRWSTAVLVESPKHTAALRLLLEARDGLGEPLTAASDPTCARRAKARNGAFRPWRPPAGCTRRWNAAAKANACPPCARPCAPPTRRRTNRVCWR